MGLNRCESFPFNYTGPGWDSIGVHTATFSATYHLFLLKSEMVSLLTLTAGFRSETSRSGLRKETWIQEHTFSPFQPCDDYTRRHSTLRVPRTGTDALR
jgi:hypothetical protein